jgi:hypothetical protein
MMKTMRERGIQFRVKVFNEEEDADRIKMRELASWKAQDTVEREVNARRTPIIFLVSVQNG